MNPTAPSGSVQEPRAVGGEPLKCAAGVDLSSRERVVGFDLEEGHAAAHRSRANEGAALLADQGSWSTPGCLELSTTSSLEAERGSRRNGSGRGRVCKDLPSRPPGAGPTAAPPSSPISVLTHEFFGKNRFAALEKKNDKAVCEYSLELAVF